jgi:hypothetical protein
MKKQIVLLPVALAMIIASCNSSGSSPGTSPDSTTGRTTVSTAGTANAAATGNDDHGIVSFMLNGQPAITTSSAKDRGHHACNYQQGTKVLTIYLQGYLTPDTYRQQMDIQVHNYTGQTGEMEVAYANYSRRDENRKEYVYSAKKGNFKLNISQFELHDGTLGLKEGTISGTFEGDLDYIIPPDGSELSKTQHITQGKFENVKAIGLK